MANGHKSGRKILNNTQYYSNQLFDRAVDLRDCTNVIPTEKDLVIPIWKEKFIIDNNENLVLKIPIKLIRHKDNIYFLGKNKSINIYCYNLSEIEFKDIKNHIGNISLKRIRELISTLDHETASLLAYAQGITKWNKHQGFCSVCGAKTLVEQKGHSRKCSDNLCKQIFFPQISPAVIVLIEYITKNNKSLCLLQKSEIKNVTRCSTLAGFVEIGESLEDAVVREMKEEVDVDISSTRYIASQPWIFSSALMIGFVARAKTKKFKVDGKEIKDASWFSAEEIERLVEEKKLIISGKHSIARFLIKSWVEKQLNRQIICEV